MTQTIFLINGPNLNLLGLRQPEMYGRETLADVAQNVRVKATALGFALEAMQSN
ncbi:MAG: type II 3-dehydroquinate dehydratase, partial [Paracoccaceae bacterium]|nr:type II 3-dehydroquinate dehydratase [Paracoccaceae bacterium]